jgi:hypothetical protein
MVASTLSQDAILEQSKDELMCGRPWQKSSVPSTASNGRWRSALWACTARTEWRFGLYAWLVQSLISVHGTSAEGDAFVQAT